MKQSFKHPVIGDDSVTKSNYPSNSTKVISFNGWYINSCDTKLICRELCQSHTRFIHVTTHRRWQL